MEAEHLDFNNRTNEKKKSEQEKNHKIE